MSIVSAFKIATDNLATRTGIKHDGESIDLADLYAMMDCQLVEPVSLTLEGQEITLWADEEGFFLQNPTANILAMHLIKTLRGELHQPYVGTMVATGFNPETGESAGLTEQQLSALEKIVGSFNPETDLEPLIAPFRNMIR